MVDEMTSGGRLGDSEQGVPSQTQQIFAHEKGPDGRIIPLKTQQDIEIHVGRPSRRQRRISL